MFNIAREYVCVFIFSQINHTLAETFTLLLSGFRDELWSDIHNETKKKTSLKRQNLLYLVVYLESLLVLNVVGEVFLCLLGD